MPEPAPEPARIRQHTTARDSATANTVGDGVQIVINRSAPEPKAPAGPPGTAVLQAVDLESPLQRARRVLGRDALLAELSAALDRADGSVHVLHGFGGCGKTTIAQALARHAADRGVPAFWIRPGDVAEGMLTIAVRLGADPAQAAAAKSDPHRSRRWAAQRLSAVPGPWLIVVDNADDPAELGGGADPAEGTGWLTSWRTGMVVITSRIGDRRVWGSGAQLHRVRPLGTEDGAHLLQDAAGIETAGDAVDPDARALAGRLSGVPLALDLAGRMIDAAPFTVPTFARLRELLDGGEATLLDGILPADTPAETADRRMLGRVWESSLSALASRGVPQTRPLLAVLARLGGSAVPVPAEILDPAVLQCLASDFGPEPARAVDRALTGLRDHGLIDMRRSPDGVTLTVHPLIAEVTLAANGDRSAEILAAAIATLAAAVPPDPADTSRWKRFQTLTEITSGLLRGHADPPAEPVISLTAAAWRVAFYLDSTGDLAGAEAMLRRALELSERAVGTQDPHTLVIRHGAAHLAVRRGELDRAEREYLAILAARESLYGEDHPDTFITVHGLAAIAARRGDLDHAGELLRRALTAARHVLGPDAQGTLSIRHDLAWIERKSGRLEAAERGFATVAADRERTLGADHLETMDTRYELALVALTRGDADTALRRSESVLAARRRVVGPDHPAALLAWGLWAESLALSGETERADRELRALLAAQERLPDVDRDGRRHRLRLFRDGLDRLRAAPD
ncbi:tetratricopeptide repeat protein [Allonocardiopsis opalescens]|uniref:Tetratricopeptide repeat protein n=1 Tax=Allonocardiopsis opalescens TaxID=1144618 RepID=A0A2T0Q4K9_9ACTN|nr:tetratricopeptide repeat protein [Allonocardiopsis opalescens]PRX98734.1 tetratricopeptide repeat protein [Allonocardiopsis opalescens]